MIAYRSYAHNNLIMFIRSRAPETTLLPSYPDGDNVSLTSLQNSTKIQPTIANPSRGRDNLGGQVVQPWQAGQLFFL